MEASSIGEKLKELRTEHGLTQEYVASAVNTTKSLISMYESDKRAPGRDTLCRLADLYDVTVDYLMGRPTEDFVQYCVREDIRDDYYQALPAIPLYENLNDYDEQRPTRYATYDDLLIDYRNDNLFYINPDKTKKNLWVLAEQTENVLPGATYLVKTGKTIKLIKGEELTKKNMKNILGEVKSVTYLY